jgi:ComF family protein
MELLMINIKRILNSLISYVYPLKCIFCGKILGINEEVEICPKCIDKIDFLHNNDTLPRTDFYPSQFCDGVFCLFEYSGFIRESIIKYKFFDKESFYRVFGSLLAKRIENYYKTYGIDAIVSVPLHKNRLRERGYNQSSLLVNEISKALNIKDISSSLIRIKDTKKQSLLDRENRKENINNAFKIVKNEEIYLKKIIIIDDILTTGSTLEECAKVLKQAGAELVLAAVVASGRK